MVLGKRKVESATQLVQFEAPAPTVSKDKVLLQTTQTQMCALLDQITWLMHHSNDVFCEVLRDANKSYERIMNLANRVNQFSELVPQVEAYLEACTTDALLANPRQTDFKSTRVETSQLLAAETRPQAITEVYDRSKLPPNLSVMDPFSDDQEPCLKKYTNPAFFIEQWVLEQSKQHEEARKKRDARRKERKEKPTQVAGRNQQKKVVQQVQLRRKQLNAMGKEFSNQDVRQSTTAQPSTTPRGSQQPSTTPRGQAAAARSPSTGAIASAPGKAAPTEKTPLAPPPAQQEQPSGSTWARPSQPATTTQTPILQTTKGAAPLPTQPSQPAPPPPQPSHPAPAAPPVTKQPSPVPAPPPSAPATPAAPAPPAPPAAPAAPPAPPSAPSIPSAPAPPPAPPVTRDLASSAGMSLAERLAAKKDALQQAPEQTKAPVDKKSALLEQIRLGSNLRKVERHEDANEEKKVASGPAGVAFDVAKILARRDAIMEMSDSDEEEGGWDD